MLYDGEDLGIYLIYKRTTYFEGIERIRCLQPEGSCDDQRGPRRAVELAETVDAGHHGYVVSLSLGLILEQVRQRTYDGEKI